MASVKDIYAYLDKRAPFSIQSDFDNSGFLIGRGASKVRRVLVALDITEDVAWEAREIGAQLIVSHHPVIFEPARHITDRTPDGRAVLALAEGKIAAVCAHTNLDKVAGGVNDALAAAVGLTRTEQLCGEGTDINGAQYGIGRIGVLPSPLPLEEFVEQVKNSLGASGVRYCDGGRPVKKVSVGGGACGDMLGDVAASGCDTFVTADVKYHLFLEARALSISLIDAGHYPTENVICPVLADWLREGFPELEVVISRRHREVTQHLL